jgi:hypothetical protein
MELPPQACPQAPSGWHLRTPLRPACKACTSIASRIASFRIDTVAVRPTDTGFEVDLVVANEQDPYRCVTDSLGDVQTVGSATARAQRDGPLMPHRAPGWPSGSRRMRAASPGACRRHDRLPWRWAGKVHDITLTRPLGCGLDPEMLQACKCSWQLLGLSSWLSAFSQARTLPRIGARDEMPTKARRTLMRRLNQATDAKPDGVIQRAKSSPGSRRSSPAPSPSICE